MKRCIGFLAIVVLATAVCHGAADPVTAEIEKLVRELGADSFEVREEASRRLVEIGRPALGALKVAAERGDDAEVRARANRAIDAITTSLPYLLENLKDRRATVRAQTATKIGLLGPAAKPALPKLLPLLHDPDDVVSEAVTGALINIDPTHEKIAKLIPAKANVEGKYKTLLRRIKVPKDRDQYKDFSDYGRFEGDNWAGYTHLPPGYWVYVYPHWYIWQEQAK
jgi:HEAT repeat protein